MHTNKDQVTFDDTALWSKRNWLRVINDNPEQPRGAYADMMQVKNTGLVFYRVQRAFVSLRDEGLIVNIAGVNETPKYRITDSGREYIKVTAGSEQNTPVPNEFEVAVSKLKANKPARVTGIVEESVAEDLVADPLFAGKITAMPGGPIVNDQDSAIDDQSDGDSSELDHLKTELEAVRADRDLFYQQKLDLENKLARLDEYESFVSHFMPGALTQPRIEKLARVHNAATSGEAIIALRADGHLTILVNGNTFDAITTLERYIGSSTEPSDRYEQALHEMLIARYGDSISARELVGYVKGDDGSSNPRESLRPLDDATDKHVPINLDSIHF